MIAGRQAAASQSAWLRVSWHSPPKSWSTATPGQGPWPAGVATGMPRATTLASSARRGVVDGAVGSAGRSRGVRLVGNPRSPSDPAAPVAMLSGSDGDLAGSGADLDVVAAL